VVPSVTHVVAASRLSGRSARCPWQLCVTEPLKALDDLCAVAWVGARCQECLLRSYECTRSPGSPWAPWRPPARPRSTGPCLPTIHLVARVVGSWPRASSSALAALVRAWLPMASLRLAGRRGRQVPTNEQRVGGVGRDGEPPWDLRLALIGWSRRPGVTEGDRWPAPSRGFQRLAVRSCGLCEEDRRTRGTHDLGH